MGKFVATRLVELLSDRGMKQTALAKLINTTQPSVSRMCSGENGISSDMVVRICAALDIHPGALFESLPDSLSEIEQRAVDALRAMTPETANMTVSLLEMATGEVKTAQPEVVWEWETNHLDRMIMLRPTGVADSYHEIGERRSIGLTRRELAGVPHGPSDGKWEKYQAGFDAREPIVDFTYRHIGSGDLVTEFVVNGTARFDADGNFKGYAGTSVMRPLGRLREMLGAP